MIPGLVLLLRALGTPALGQLREAGIDALNDALREKLQDRREAILIEALERLENDGDVVKLAQPGPFVDQDGVRMTGRQYFTHQALWAIPRTVLGGVPSDILRDHEYQVWGHREADARLMGVTHGPSALAIIFDRLVEQIL